MSSKCTFLGMEKIRLISMSISVGSAPCQPLALQIQTNS